MSLPKLIRPCLVTRRLRISHAQLDQLVRQGKLKPLNISMGDTAGERYFEAEVISLFDKSYKQAVIEALRHKEKHET